MTRKWNSVYERAVWLQGCLVNSVKVTCLSRSPTVALILTMCSAQVSMHHAAWRIKIEFDADLGEDFIPDISPPAAVGWPNQEASWKKWGAKHPLSLDHLHPLMCFERMTSDVFRRAKSVDLSAGNQRLNWIYIKTVHVQKQFYSYRKLNHCLDCV